MVFTKPSGGNKPDKVWLSEDEYTQYLSILKSVDERAYLYFRLCADVCLRRKKAANVSMDQFWDTENSGTGIVFLEMPDRKHSDPDAEEEARRKWSLAAVRVSLYEELKKHAEKNDRDDDEPIIDIGGEQLNNLLKEAGEIMAEEEGLEPFRHIRAHDGRRYFAYTLRHIYNVDKELIKYLGGWSTDSIFDDYALVWQPEEIRVELSRKNALDADVDVPPREEGLAKIHSRIDDLAMKVEAQTQIEKHDIEYEKIASMNRKDFRDFKNWRSEQDSSSRETSLADYVGSGLEAPFVWGLMGINLIRDRIYKEHEAAIDSNKVDWPPTPQRAVATCLGLSLLTVIVGVSLALSGTFWIDLHGGDVHATAGAQTGALIGVGLIYHELPEL